MPYLSGAHEEKLNFEAGENVLLRLDPTAQADQFCNHRRRSENQAAAFPPAANTWTYRLPGHLASGR